MMAPKPRWRGVLDRHSHNTVIGTLVLFICAASGIIFWLSFQHVAQIYLAETERTLGEIQGDFLRISVENVVREIDRLKEAEEKRWQEIIADRLELVQLGLELDEARFARYFRALMEAEPGLTAVLWRQATGEILYGNGELLAADSALPGLRFSEGLVSGELGALWGVSRAFLEERIEVQVRERLAALDLGKGIWFTIAETLPEVQFLDALTFSAWYEDLNWLITMGVHRGELERYVAQTAETGGRLAVLLSVRLVLILVLVVIAAVALVLLVEHLFFRQHTAQLELQINEDLLTGAKSRRCGVQVLSEAFAAFQAGNSSPEIFMFDVDRLKEINDCFGHSAGDKLLQAVAGEVRRVLGGAGEIIRWGGDEFVVLAPAGGQGQKLADRIVQSISALEFRFDQEAVRASISLGAARFQKGDASFREALERADQKMYEMKRSGKTEVH